LFFFENKNVFMKRQQNAQKYFVETKQKWFKCEEKGSINRESDAIMQMKRKTFLLNE